jgi:gamma-glutamyl:cysteine ligase YbdK (ATP-grasp superfamily)
VIELKTNGPAPSLAGLPTAFQASIARIDALLAPMNARLLSGAMHPWMDPHREMRLWPHDYSPVYQAYDRIFDCRGHGWGNLQSMHVNLPFADDREFARLHAAIRVMLPILPALAASSPIADGRPTGFLDTRLEVYRKNSARIPSMCGAVIPEAVFSQAQYTREILERIWSDLAPFDPEGVLRYEFANSRGAIARFDRSAIEIRVLDVQECAGADLAIAAAVSSAVRALAEERWCSFDAQARWDVEPLARIFLECVRLGEAAVIREREYLAMFGYPGAACSAAELWQHVVGELWIASRPAIEPWLDPLTVILREGTLARRLLRATGSSPSRGRLTEVWRELADCLAAGRMFRG